ncbi:hypothetical protein P691DRAFT_809958, partial [Macrolepiota fuliginosa MF-IS2]
RAAQLMDEDEDEENALQGDAKNAEGEEYEEGEDESGAEAAVPPPIPPLPNRHSNPGASKVNGIGHSGKA